MNSDRAGKSRGEGPEPAAVWIVSRRSGSVAATELQRYVVGVEGLEPSLPPSKGGSGAREAPGHSLDIYSDLPGTLVR